MIAKGGYNEYDEIHAWTMQEGYQLETKVRSEGYIQIGGDGREISDSDYEIFAQNNNMAFLAYVEKHNTKVFVFKPSYDDYMHAKATNIDIPLYTIEELMTSAVIIDYHTLEQIELSGTFDDEIGDAIPSTSATGWLEIHSPINCEVVLWNDELNRYYYMYVEKESPYLIRMKRGSYRVVEMNGMAVNNRITDEGEDALPYKNRIQIREWNTKENPYILDFTNITIKYRLTDVDLPDEANRDDRAKEPYEVPVEKIRVIEKTDDVEVEVVKETNGVNIFGVIIFVSLVSLLLVYAVLIVKKKRNGADDDEYFG